MKKTIAVLATSALVLSTSTAAFAQSATAPAEPEVVSQGSLMEGSAGLSTELLVGGAVAIALLAVALSNTNDDQTVTTTATATSD